MAELEVSMSSGQVFSEKREDSERSENSRRTQVILQLHGLKAVTAGTTVSAIESHRRDSTSGGGEVEYGYPITCGDSRAVLLIKKFVCPGINARCVNFNDQLISPKQFVHLAGKATLKDWKRAIRLGGVMLRKMMDSGQIDFYQHESVCSNTCRSTKFEALINSTRPPPGNAAQQSMSCASLDPAGGQLPPLTGEAHTAREDKDPLEDKLGATTEQSNGAALLINSPTVNTQPAKIKQTDTADGVLGLWRGILDAGLMGDVLSRLHTKMVTTLKGVELRSAVASLQETDAHLLNSLCETFGLLDSVKEALNMRPSQFEDRKSQHSSVYVLREILEDPREKKRFKKTHKTSKHL